MVVGPNPKHVPGDADVQDTIIVHEDLICDVSEFFKAACKKEWTPAEGQGKERVIPLPEHEPNTFRWYLESIYNSDWLGDLAAELYSGEMCFEAGSQATEEGSATLHLLCKLWILADFLGDVNMQDTIIRRLAMLKELVKALFTTAILEHVVHATSVDSRLQQLIVDYLASYFSPRELEKVYTANLPVDFLMRIAKSLAAIRDLKSSKLMGKYRSGA